MCLKWVQTATPRTIQTLVLRMQCKQCCIAQGIVAYHPNGLTCIARAHRTSPPPPLRVYGGCLQLSLRQLDCVKILQCNGKHHHSSPDDIIIYTAASSPLYSVYSAALRNGQRKKKWPHLSNLLTKLFLLQSAYSQCTHSRVVESGGDMALECLESGTLLSEKQVKSHRHSFQF